MKRPVYIFFLVFLSGSLWSQGEMAFFDHLVQKQYDQASGYFNNEINLCVLEFEGMVTRSQANKRMQTFFDSHPPVSFSVNHKGKSKGGQSSYYVVHMKTERGVFRLFTYFDKIGGQFKISEFRIEP